jgi:hypothetical protein
VTEAQLQEHITDMCDARGLIWIHNPDSRRVRKGWVDLIILGHGALFVELKSWDGRRSKKQVAMADSLILAGLPYRLWRPIDLDMGVIENALNELATPMI